MMGGFGMGLGGFGFLWMAIFWIVIVVAAIWFVGNLFPRSASGHSPTNTPESDVDIAKRRYARGEISQEEYQTLLHHLEQSAPVRADQ
jgi:putative membrane protein